MKKWKQALALVLALVMALSLVALPSFAEGEETGGGTAVTGGSTNTPGLELRKAYDPSTGLLTLEAYATGSTTTTTSTEPVDIILVLDVSGSMTDEPYIYSYSPVYSVDSDGTYYYQDANGQYRQAHYCDGKRYTSSKHAAGWYTEDHQSWGQCQGETGIRLAPKTSASDADTGHTQFYEYGQSTKLDALKSAVNGFIDSVAAKSADSQIAIVKFAGKKTNTVGNDTYREDGYTHNYTQIVSNLTPAGTGAATLKGYVNAFTAAGATSADYGMQHAQTIITGAANDGRKKVVVMFTDGAPTHGNSFSNSVANTAISNSKAIKDNGATVYTIGCFGGTPGSNVTNYMNYVSSNYPNATSMTNAGTKASDNFYKTVGSTADLDAIFQEISQTAGGATLTLGSETVLRDVVSEYFDLPENAAANIAAKSYSCTALNADGTPIWNETADQGTNYAVNIEGRTISVTGFDYSENWVGKDVNTGVVHPGKKLVVTIPIQDNGTGMGTVPTNGPDSAVYDKDGKQVCPFAQPTAYFPYFTVTHIQSNVNDNGVNYGTDGGSTKHRVPTDGTKFSLTSVVTENYLYGGSFNGEDCTTVQTYANGENPTAFTPVNQATYYIWEVPNTYLRPFTFYVWQHVDGKETVTKLYPLVGVDRALYADVGFAVCWGTTYDKTTAEDVHSGCGELTGSASVGTKATVYQRLLAVKAGAPVESWYLMKGAATMYPGDIKATDTVIDEGCIGGFRLAPDQFESFKDKGITYRPYWVTLDGVRVDSVRSRTLTFKEGSNTPIYDKSQTGMFDAGYSYVGNTSATRALSFQACMLADDSQPVVDDRLTVTVVDGNNTIEVKVAPNGSVRDQVAYQAPAGKVFAGWFADQAYTTPADLDQVTEDTTIYAKYVSDSYLDLHYVRNGLFRLRGVTLISAVDNPANYQESGIIVDGEKLPVAYAARYRLFYTASGLFGAARNARLMIAQQSLSGSGTLEVTPYWVTKDGTTVLGQSHTLHYSARGIWE